MSATNFPIGNVEGQIAELNEHIGNLSAFENKTIANNLSTSSGGAVLDARQGKELNDTFSSRWKEGSEAKKITLYSGFWLIVTRYNETVNSGWIIYAYSGSSMGTKELFNSATIGLSMGSNYVLTLTGNVSSTRAIYLGG